LAGPLIELGAGTVRREPFNGLLPDLGEPALADYSPLCRLVLELLLGLDAEADGLANAWLALAQGTRTWAV